MFGCVVFVHHFETVAGSFPHCSASHLLVFFFSTSITLSLLMSAMTLFKLLNFSQSYSHFLKLPNFCGNCLLESHYVFLTKVTQDFCPPFAVTLPPNSTVNNFSSVNQRFIFDYPWKIVNFAHYIILRNGPLKTSNQDIPNSDTIW